MKKFLIFLGIMFVASLAVKDTIDRFKELDNVAVTPSQLQMRTPAQQNTGQSQFDVQTQKLRNRNSDRYWDNNPNNYGNRFDNFNRNPSRDQNRLKDYTPQNPFERD
jgi:hypothetical protein